MDKGVIFIYVGKSNEAELVTRLLIRSMTTTANKRKLENNRRMLQQFQPKEGVIVDIWTKESSSSMLEGAMNQNLSQGF